MKTQLTFNNMQSVAQQIFGVELHRSGSRFRIQDGKAWLGEGVPGCGTQFSLKSLRGLFQEWLNHPEVTSLLAPTLKANLDIDHPIKSSRNTYTPDEELGSAVEAIVEEFMLGDMEEKAQSFGIRIAAVEGGFHLFDVGDDRQLGFDGTPWSMADVVAFCQKYEESQRTGFFMA